MYLYVTTTMILLRVSFVIIPEPSNANNWLDNILKPWMNSSSCFHQMSPAVLERTQNGKSLHICLLSSSGLPHVITHSHHTTGCCCCCSDWKFFFSGCSIIFRVRESALFALHDSLLSFRAGHFVPHEGPWLCSSRHPNDALKKMDKLLSLCLQ